MPPRGAQRGDFTGQERQRLTEEKAKELAERQKEIGLVNQIDIVTEEEGIFDPVTGEMVELPEGAQAKIDKLQEAVVVEDDPILDPTEVRIPDPMKDLKDLEIKQQQKPERPNALEVQDMGSEPITVDEEWKVFRVNQDVEQMTYGMKPDGSLNMMDFERGRKYRAPKDLYDWLDSRGVIYH